MTDTRRVVFVSQMFPPEKGGNASRVHDMSTNLQSGDWDVSVLSPPPSYPPGEFDRSWRRTETESVDGVTVHRLWTWQPTVENPGMVRRLPYYLLFGIHAMLWLLWNVRRYDAVVTSTPPISTGAPGLLAAMLGKPWVVDVRDLWIDASISLGYLERGSTIERISRRFQRLVLHTSDRIIVTTETIGQRVRDQYGDTVGCTFVTIFGAPGRRNSSGEYSRQYESLGEKIVVIPNGVDTDRFSPHGELTRETTRPEETEPRAVGVGRAIPTGDNPTTDGGSRPTIIYTGNLGSAQDLEACIRAMTHLDHGDAVLQLVGSGDVESKLRQLVRDLGVSDRVEFIGPIPRERVPDYLNRAMVGVAPLENTETLSYAMPTKVYEYMACALPTVVTGRGEIERFVAESGGGIHAENDPRRIAERFDELLADEHLRRRLGRRGREYVVEHYDRAVITRRLGAELSRLVESDAGS